MSAEQSGLRRERRKMVISLTPLIDIVFILVIFFMLASSFTRTHALGMATPASGGKSGPPAVGDTLRLTVLGNQRFRLDGELVSEAGLVTRLDGWSQDQKVIVRAGAQAVLQDMVWLLDQATQRGLAKLSVSPKPAAE